MKKSIIQFVFVCLLASIVSSCATQRSFFFAKHTIVKASDNSIENNGCPILKIDRSVLNLAEKKLTFDSDLLSERLKRHASTILRECNSIQDTVIAVSLDFIIVKSDKIMDAKYRYQLDFETGRWVCMSVDIPFDMILFTNSAYSFYRSVYITKRRNRVIIKDCFGDVSVIYVIQGKDRKTTFYSTAVWDPADFKWFISTSNYIIDRINPISHSIARNK